MYSGMTFQQLEPAENLPKGSIIPADMGDGSGVKKVTKELLEEEIGKDLKIGNLEELNTETKESIVAAINEVAESGGGGGSVDILDTKEEIEANTEPGKSAGALGVKEMFGELNNKLNGCSLEQDGDDFYIVGADAVRKKLGSSQIHYVEGVPNNSTYTFDYEPQFILFNWPAYDLVFRYLIVETGKTNGYDCNITKISDTKYSVSTNGQGKDPNQPFNLIWF